MTGTSRFMPTTWAILSLAVCCLPARAQIAGKAIDPATAPALAALLRDLGSEDLARRAAAQKQLEALPASQRSAVASAAQSATDPELKARLLARIDTFEEQAALHPPPISLDLKNAAPDQIIDQLKKATGILFVKMFLSDRAGTQCTLSIKDAPLMEALQQIALQAPFTYGTTPGGIGLRFLAPDRAPVMAPIAAGPLLIFPGIGASPASPDSASPKGPGISLRLACYADPRMMLVGQSLGFTSAADDQGSPLTFSQGSGDPAFGSGPGPDELGRINQMLWNVTITPPADPKSTLTLKGTALLRVVTQSATRTLADPDRHLNERIEVGGREISITRFTTQGNPLTVNLGLSLSPSAVTPHPPFGGAEKEGSAAESPIYFTLTDSTGQTFTQRISRSQGTILVRAPNAPYSLIFTAPLKWKLLTVPLELKGLVQR